MMGAGLLRSGIAMSRICFAPETQLQTPQDWRRINRCQPGELVLSAPDWDPAAPPTARVVEEVLVNHGRLLNVHVQGQEIRTTPLHPFYVQGKDWTPAAKLQPGDRLRRHDGQWVAVEEATDNGEESAVYDLRVAEHHTYFVGGDESEFSVWADNSYARDDAQGRKLFRNDEERLLEGELRLADALGVRPVKAADPEFAQYAREAVGRNLPFVQHQNGEVVFVPGKLHVEDLGYSLNHTAASRGADVLAAGKANTYVARNGRVTIREFNIRSGHDSPSADTLGPAAEVICQQRLGVLGVVPFRGHDV